MRGQHEGAAAGEAWGVQDAEVPLVAGRVGNCAPPNLVDHTTRNLAPGCTAGPGGGTARGWLPLATAQLVDQYSS